MTVPKVTYEIYYQGTNITGSILPYLISFSYTDKSKGEADELEITLEDSDQLWQNAWYPTKGDKISAKIFDLGKVLDCGTFTVDEIVSSISIDGDILSIKGIGAGINKAIRTKNSYAHENKTLREIANTIAAKHGLKLQGNIENVRIARETQYREHDLKFLQRLANDYGYTFSIRENLLIFTSVFELENKTEALTINRNEIISSEITDKTSNSFRAVKLSYHNPKEKTVITFEKKEDDPAFTGGKVDTLEIKLRAENKQQAEIKSKVALYNANSLQQEGNATILGNILALAWNNCTLLGRGVFSGNYYIRESSHLVEKDGGYTTSIDIKRTGLIEKEKKAKKKEESESDSEF
ncbi:MAG: hypothetical protein ABIN48_05060 [Ginsengibacter sp.]